MANLLAAWEEMGRIAAVRTAAAEDRRTAVRNMVDTGCARIAEANWCGFGWYEASQMKGVGWGTGRGREFGICSSRQEVMINFSPDIGNATSKLGAAAELPWPVQCHVTKWRQVSAFQPLADSRIDSTRSC